MAPNSLNSGILTGLLKRLLKRVFSKEIQRKLSSQFKSLSLSTDALTSREFGALNFVNDFLTKFVKKRHNEWLDE